MDCSWTALDCSSLVKLSIGVPSYKRGTSDPVPAVFTVKAQIYKYRTSGSIKSVMSSLGHRRSQEYTNSFELVIDI